MKKAPKLLGLTTVYQIKENGIVIREFTSREDANDWWEDMYCDDYGSHHIKFNAEFIQVEKLLYRKQRLSMY